MDKPLKPAEFVENKLITEIISGELAKNSKLPGERDLAKAKGVTRPTLREALQRLSRDGWVKIRHGKPTIVNDFWDKGGLGILKTLVDYVEILPEDLIESMLEFRTIVLPDVVRLAYEREPDTVKKYLRKSKELKAPGEFAEFDWNLQLLMGKCSKNKLFPLIFNDFTKSYKKLASLYFEFEKTRKMSAKYYKDLEKAFSSKNSEVKEIVKEVMENSNDFWKALRGKEFKS